MSIPSNVERAEAPKQVALLYHELRTEPSAYSYVLPYSRFEEHLRLLASLPPGAYMPVLTFDDGHLSNFTHAFPALERMGRKAHFFITAGWTGTRHQYMEGHHLRALHEAGHVIGAHGWTHTLLTQCNGTQLRHELEDARSLLQDLIGAAVTSMSLPGGRSNSRVLQACFDAGYRTVWTSTPGSVSTVDESLVGRFNVLAGHTDTLLRRLLDPASGELARAGRISQWKAMAQRALGDRNYAILWGLLNRKEGAAEDPAAEIQWNARPIASETSSESPPQ